MGGKGQRGNNAACSALCQFSVTSSATYRQIGPFWRWFLGGWLCVGSRTQWVSPVRLGVPPAASTPQVFSIRGFVVLFPCFGALGCMVCLTLQLFLLVYPHTNVGLHALPTITLLWVPSASLPVSTPPTSLDECFFFNSWVVRLPYSFIFCQFWLFFVFKFIVVLLLVVQGGKVYLPSPPSWPEVPGLLFF